MNLIREARGKYKLPNTLGKDTTQSCFKSNGISDHFIYILFLEFKFKPSSTLSKIILS